MERTLARAGAYRLEGLCGSVADGALPPGSRIRIDAGGEGIERLEARFLGQAFAPHRHDTYAIGITLSGVQTFNYRGERRHCLPGECHILHPDEKHDGGAGTAAGFSYRIAYVDPALVQEAIGGRPLPFVADPVVKGSAIGTALPMALWHTMGPIGDVERVAIVAALADLLEALSGRPSENVRSLRLASLSRVRDRIAEDPGAPLAIATLEAVSGLDRWTLARDFRAAFGTSPTRFRTMRQLDRARRMIRRGAPLAQAALAAGFADQSHMSRMFKRAYGLTPARWGAALVESRDPSRDQGLDQAPPTAAFAISSAISFG
jgi:AraC-like DNA-binding protein